MNKLACINLKSWFGDRYRVGYEESYFAERTKRTIEDPWLMIIPAKYGHFLPWGDDRLAASVDGHTGIAGRLRRISCCRIEQNGDFGELTVSFHVDDFDKVAGIMRPHRRRVLTEEQRQAAAERLAKFAFQPAVPGRSTAPESHDRGVDDSECRVTGQTAI